MHVVLEKYCSKEVLLIILLPRKFCETFVFESRRKCELPKRKINEKDSHGKSLNLTCDRIFMKKLSNKKSCDEIVFGNVTFLM